ncbi:putative endo-beta-1,4-glucanase D [Paramyrothecium foliicola]|nr:putative endo-beta-1,4-glucanase D [Paramyrothecium foliicola]
MHSPYFLYALTALAPLVQGHFTFVRIAKNGEWQAPFQYIRNKTSPFEERSTPNTKNNVRLYNFPTFVTDLPNSVRCGRDNMNHAAETEVLKVKVGDTLEFVATAAETDKWSTNEVQWDACPDGRGFCTESGTYMELIHDGPVLVHLSKVPDGQDVHEYDGSGRWTKIHTTGLEIRKDRPQEPVYWLPHNDNKTPPRFIFKLPKQTPTGQYLLRVDLIWPGLLWIKDGKVITDGHAQFYASCAQIEVESDASGSLPCGIRIPEDVSLKSPGMQVSLEQYNGKKVDEDYVYPGGPLWDGETLVEDRAPSTD